MKERISRIFERQSNIYHLYKNKILEEESRKQLEMERILETHQKLEQERLDKLQSEAALLKNESKKMHYKILQLQILDKKNQKAQVI